MSMSNVEVSLKHVPGHGGLLLHTVGYVEQVTDEVVSGWIGSGGPGEAGPVIAEAPNGRRLTFLPSIARPDICEASGVDGCLGFSIPTAALRQLGPVVCLRNTDEIALTLGARVVLPTPRVQHGPPCVFLHIPKTAGTSIRNGLAGGLAGEDAAFVYPGTLIRPFHDDVKTLSAVQRAGLQLIIGHHGFGYGEQFYPDVRYATFLRLPAARLRSNYFHHADRGQRFAIGGADRSVAEVASLGLIEEFDNVMVRLISGCRPSQVPIGKVGAAHVEIALANIRARFRFVGLAERMGEHYPALCAAIGIRGGSLSRDNLRDATHVGGDGSDVAWDAVMHNNRFDAMLYEQVVEQGLAGRALQPERSAPR